MRAILTLAAKDLRLLVQDRGGVFFTFVFPLLYAVFIGAIFSQAAGDYKGRRVPTLLVDEDNTAASRGLIARLHERDELAIEPSDRSEGLQLVRRGRKPACVIIPSGYERQRGRRFAVGPPTLQLASDPARQGEAGVISATLLRVLIDDLRDELSDPARLSQQLAMSGQSTATSAAEPAGKSDPDATPSASGSLAVQALAAAAGSLDRAALGRVLSALEPLRIEPVEVNVLRDRPRNLYAVSFPQGLMWGAIGCTAAFGVALVMERVRGTLTRIRTAPLGAWQILAGKALACLAVNLAVAALLLGLAWSVFGVAPHSPVLLVLALLCTAIAFVGLMLVLSLFGKTEHGAATIYWGVLTLLAMVGGAMVPELLMPPILRTIGALSPVKWAIYAVEGALWREMSLSELAPALLALAGFGAACYAIATRLSQWMRA